MNFFRVICGVLLCWLCAGQIGWAQSYNKQGGLVLQNLSVPDSAILPGLVMVKLSDKSASELAITQNAAGNWNTSNKQLNTELNRLGATRVQLLFAPVLAQARANELGDSEDKMESSGLLQWYSIQIPVSSDVKAACKILQAIPGVSVAEPVGKIVANSVPNDPLFANQWVLQNTGQTGGRAGADISAVQAWDIETGKRETIVSVHDGGVQLDHPDLQRNLSVAKSFNFVNNSSTLTYDLHGTHVAGILGAVRNNATGVAGIAGGDGTANSGVTMMSLQIIGGTPVQAAHEALSFVYAANNGVAISQNSWSYNSPNFFPQYMAEAIDYFIAYGGGTVLKGGMVIFSAGNYNSELKYYPAAYDKVFSVAATNHFDTKANYSSYGSWVEIAAPGGDSDMPMVSTVTGGGYGNLYGTSMACPLVSGAAALLVSHLPGRLLADDLRSLLLYGVDDIYPLNSGFTGKLGSGRLNIFKALKRADSILAAPVLPAITQFTVSPACSTLNLAWNVPLPATQVVIAMAPAGDPIGLPFGRTYLPGDSLPSGGVIVYAGAAGSVELPMPIDGSSWQYRIWSTNATGTSYSLGTSRSITIAKTVAQLSSVGAANSISLSWTRQCPQRDVLLAFSTDGSFGVPVGNPAAVTDITGGGTVLQRGNQTGFVHNNLLGDATYYYACYPYLFNGTDWVYGEPQLLLANTLCTKQALPIVESFTNATFPAPGWKITDGGPAGSLVADGRTWRRLQLVGSKTNDDISVLINAYTQNGGNSKEVLRLPAFDIPLAADVDSVVVSFDYAYRSYSNDVDLADSLELAWTDNCGSTYHSLWKKGGLELSTVPGFSTTEFIPGGPQDWLPVRIHLKPILPANQTVALALIGTNKYGQNLWVDNVQVNAFKSKDADVALLNALPMTDTMVCKAPLTPSFKIVNRGGDTLKTLQLQWLRNGVLSDSVDYSNLRVAPNKDTVLAIKNLTLPIGSSGYTFYARKPNNRPDVQPNNDTLRLNISLPGTAVLPLTESFETANALPTGWMNRYYFDNWKATNTAAYTGTQSMMAHRYTDQSQFGRIDLISPVLLAVPLADSVFIEFSVAAALRNTGGVTTSDTLEIWLSHNCDQTMQAVYSQTGIPLATVTNALASEFVPSGKAEWKRRKIDISYLSEFYTRDFQCVFRIKKGKGNNIYIDDVQVYAKTIPPALKQAEFGVYPNPFDQQFTIWHLREPQDLVAARLINASGQVLRKWSWNRNVPQTLQVNTAGLIKGLYTLELQYQGFVRRQKLVKF
ncbi:MAG TPA: S8 family serine peptidase [Phnomibacter sp.]|nr:S8 family serine peptidase [Phnomibacter sp.]